MILRDYQRAAVNAVYFYLKEQAGKNPCVVIPTGGGKTPIIATLCRDCARWGKRVAVLSHVKELLEQSRNTLLKVDPTLDIGIFSAGLNRKETQHQITVAGIQSVFRHADDFEPFDLIIIDEAHLIPPDGDGMYQTFLQDCRERNPNVRLVGMTATPFRTGSGMICSPDGLLNDVCYTAEVGDLIQAGWLSRLISKEGFHKADFSALHTRAGEFLEQEVNQAVNNQDEIFHAVKEIIRRTEDRHSVLVFAANVEHARNIQRALHDQSGKEVGLVTGETESSERLELLARFRGEKVPISLWGDVAAPLKFLVNVNVLTTGFDALNIDCVVLMRPTASASLYVQMVGRGLRKCEGKTDCLILDYGENIRRHGCIDRVFIKERKECRGHAPTKVCPQCQEVVHISARTCPDCGFAFQFESEKNRTQTKAAEEEILSGVPERKEVEVRFAVYQYWTKRNDPDAIPTMRVVYSTSDGDVCEWVCPQHTGWAQAKFARWWQERSEYPGIPTTANDAVEAAQNGELRLPKKLLLEKKSGERFWNVRKAFF